MSSAHLRRGRFLITLDGRHWVSHGGVTCDGTASAGGSGVCRNELFVDWHVAGSWVPALMAMPNYVIDAALAASVT